MVAPGQMTRHPAHRPSSRPDMPDRLEQLEYWLDRAFRVPGTDLRFGLDGALGLIPGVGDTVTGLVSAYLVWEARQMGVRKRVQARMLKNVAVDWLIGSIPLVGDLFDFAFKANSKNIRLLREERERMAGPRLVCDRV